ncbi:Uncharacterised protein [Vibrio cholerae]|nr:Uncharacterised protein [Vibrio cholerae]
MDLWIPCHWSECVIKNVCDKITTCTEGIKRTHLGLAESRMTHLVERGF